MEEEMRSLIENYCKNQEKLEKLQAKLIELLEYNTKVTASYGHNAGGGKGSVSSKVERHALKIYDTQQQLMEIGNSLTMVDNAQKILTNRENEVIDLVKIYKNKLTKIAKIIGRDKKYVFDTRNRSIRKMVAYIEQQHKEGR